MFQSVNFPNFLSLLRILLTPLIIWFLFQGKATLVYAISFFTLAGLTDRYDGYLARHHGLVTELGNFLDPLADKVLIFGTFFAFYALRIVPLWFVVILCVRDLSITLLRTFMLYQGKPLVTSNFGKVKTVVQAAGIYVIFTYLLCLNFALPPVIIKSAAYLKQASVYVVAIFTLVSALDYFFKNRRQLFGMR